MINKKLLKHLDFTLIFIITLIFIVGIFMIASATNVTEVGLTRQVKMQVVAFVVGLVVMGFMLLIDYNTYGDFYRIIYGLSIVALLLVYIPGLGVMHGGARSWINFGIIDVQTSELAKIGFVLFFAKYLEEKEGQIESIKDLIIPGFLVAPFLLLVLKQPDLGTALVFVAMFVGMIFVSGINYKLFMGGVFSGIAASPLLYFILKPHQRERIDAFLHPNDTTLKGNYHVMQSKITIGSGEVFGRGLFKGVYHRYDYLPVQESDFIFAVLVEELGFVGGAVIIFLYFTFLSRLLRIAKKSKDMYGTLIVTGVTCMFAFQIIENIGMTMGMMPVTGITLPFLSYGGSSIIASMLSIGLVLNVYMRRKRSSFTL
jgi:rod shape determining protein RodA